MEYCGDDWPVMVDGSKYDGKQLLALVREGKSPFQGAWDVNLLIEEIEEKLNTKVLDIPMVYDGANYYVSFSHIPSHFEYAESHAHQGLDNRASMSKSPTDWTS